MFVNDGTAFEVLMVEVHHDKGGLGSGVKKVLLSKDFRVHAMGIGVHFFKHLRSNWIVKHKNLKLE